NRAWLPSSSTKMRGEPDSEVVAVVVGTASSVVGAGTSAAVVVSAARGGVVSWVVGWPDPPLNQMKANAPRPMAATAAIPIRAALFISLWRSARQGGTQRLRQTLHRHPVLAHRVPVADGDGIVVEGVEVEGDAERGADL